MEDNGTLNVQFRIELLGGGWLNLMQSKNNHKHKLQQGWKFWFRTTEHRVNILSGNIFLAGCINVKILKSTNKTAPDHTNNNDRLR